MNETSFATDHGTAFPATSNKGSGGCQSLSSFHKLIVSQVTPPAGHFHTLNKHKLSEMVAELTHPSENQTQTTPSILAVLLALMIIECC